MKINDRYNDFINQHLKEKGLIGDNKHVLGCDACKDKKSNTIALLEIRIEEIQSLKSKIGSVIK